MQQVTFSTTAGCLPCPICGNTTRFTAHSMLALDDLCQVWIECQCGYDPTANQPDQRLKSAMGRMTREAVMQAGYIWNECITPDLVDSKFAKLVEIRDFMRGLFTRPTYWRCVTNWSHVLCRQMKRRDCTVDRAMLQICAHLERVQDRLWCEAACVEILEGRSPKVVT